MFTFYSRSCKAYLSTNTKVLSSTLRNQTSLMRSNRKLELLNVIKKRTPGVKSKPHYLIVRDPYKRVESFFKEKLRSKVKMATSSKSPYKLKLHQEIFYPYAGVKVQDDLKTIQEKLLLFTFEQFILALPEVYMKDAHLRPQSIILKPRLKNIIPFKFKFDKIFKLEEQTHLFELSKLLNLDLTIHINSTRKKDEEVIWSNEALDIVNKLYARDFYYFDYPLKSNNY